jgi:hypothetical protein
MCDTCDMIELQLTLAGAGHIQLYGFAERFVKNHVTACQFAPDEWMKKHVVCCPEGAVDETGQISYTDVMERAAGGFVCVSYPDDLYTAYPGSRYDEEPSCLIDISACCSGSGAKAAYVAWRDAIIEGGDAIRINLSIDCRRPSVDMTCEEGRECRVTVRSRVDKPVLFRVPEGIRADSIDVKSDGTPVCSTIEGDYILIDAADCRQHTLKLEYPLVDREETCEVAGLSYNVAWRGSKVCSVQRADGGISRRNPYREWFHEGREN